MTDPNSAEAWDSIYLTEGGIATWRTYPKAFAAVQKIVGRGGFPSSVLEFGCGVGILAKILSDDGHFVTGIDISPYAIQTMKSEFGIGGIVWDAKNIPTPFVTGEFDWCVATEFLEHFTPFDANRIVGEIARVAKRAVFCVPNNTLPPAACKEHNNVFTPVSLAELLLKHYKHVKLAGFIEEFDIDPTIYMTGGIMMATLLAECSNLEETP